MAIITVTAKITAGVHRKHGAILEGHQYTIDEADFAPQLFYTPGEEPTPETNTVPVKKTAGQKKRRS